MILSIGERLVAERKRLNLSQEALAAAGGVTKRTQINYEANVRSPDANYLSGVASAGVNVAFVVTGKEILEASSTPTRLGDAGFLISQVVESVKGETQTDPDGRGQRSSLELPGDAALAYRKATSEMWQTRGTYDRGVDLERLAQAVEIVSEEFGLRAGPRVFASLVALVYSTATANLNEARPALRLIRGGK